MTELNAYEIYFLVLKSTLILDASTSVSRNNIRIICTCMCVCVCFEVSVCNQLAPMQGGVAQGNGSWQQKRAKAERTEREAPIYKYTDI